MATTITLGTRGLCSGSLRRCFEANRTAAIGFPSRGPVPDPRVVPARRPGAAQLPSNDLVAVAACRLETHPIEDPHMASVVSVPWRLAKPVGRAASDEPLGVSESDGSTGDERQGNARESTDGAVH